MSSPNFLATFPSPANPVLSLGQVLPGSATPPLWRWRLRPRASPGRRRPRVSPSCPCSCGCSCSGTCRRGDIPMCCRSTGRSSTTRCWRRRRRRPSGGRCPWPSCRRACSPGMTSRLVSGLTFLPFSILAAMVEVGLPRVGARAEEDRVDRVAHLADGLRVRRGVRQRDGGLDRRGVDLHRLREGRVWVAPRDHPAHARRSSPSASRASASLT